MNDSNGEFESFRTNFLRDINRVSDNDRNSRKRGLQKLLDELPWNDKNNNLLKQLILSDILSALYPRISDPVEKCRELCLKCFYKVVSGNFLPVPVAEEAITCLCARLDDIPYPEQVEEMRLQILQIILITLQKLSQPITPTLANKVLSAVGKSSMDPFPSVKKESAEILSLICRLCPSSIRFHFKSLLKGFTLNCSHQHSKIRTTTIKVKLIY